MGEWQGPERNRNMAGPRIRGQLEAQLIRVLGEIRDELKSRKISMQRWSLAASLDRTTVWKLFRYRRPVNVATADALIDAAWALTHGELEVRLSLVFK